MAKITRKHALAALTIAAAFAVYKKIEAQRRRELRLLRGEIRPLSGLWTTVNECRMFARASVSARSSGRLPIILVHGMGISSSYLVPTAERLATEFSVFAPDLPGHGNSDTPPHTLDVPELADALVAWMNVVGIERAMLIANSMGCQIAVDLAVRYPHRVDRMVLTGPTVDPVQRTWMERIGRFFVAGFYEKVSLKWHVLADYSRMGARVFSEARFACADKVETKLPYVAAPTLLVRGEHDTIVPQRWLEEATRMLPLGWNHVIEHWGHAVNYSAAPQLVAAIRPFLHTPEPRLFRNQMPAIAGNGETVAPDAVLSAS